MDVLGKVVLQLAALLVLLGLTSSCQVPYLIKSATGQAEILAKRKPISSLLNDPQLSAELSEDAKHKLRLSQEAREFAERTLKLKATQNYTSYVKLNRPYVTYVVSAAAKDKLEQYLWSFPIVGSVPYKGFFEEADAKEEAKLLQEKNLDTYIRGVSAYSTLGWFQDPLLSSMLRYSDRDLVETIVHETVHATLYIKSEAKFNERLASYLGQRGAQLFYLAKEGPNSKTLIEKKEEDADERLFAEFITSESDQLERWYQEKNAAFTEQERENRLLEIQNRFKQNVLPKAKRLKFESFLKHKLNNAQLLTYKLYMDDMSDFEALDRKLQGDFQALVKFCKSLESQEDPEAFLKKYVSTN